MASGHVNRIYRPNTWLHRPSLRREDFSCQPGAVHTWHKTDMAGLADDVRSWGQRWGNRPAPGCGYLKILGAALQADGETRSVVTASSIRRRSAAWTILLDWTYRSRRPASALWMTRAGSCGK